MKLTSASALWLFVGLALFAGGIVVPTAQATCTVVVLGTCGTGCDPVAAVGCGTNNCDIVILSDCLATGWCTVTTTDVLDPNDCGGTCEVNVGWCDPAGNTGDCTINVGRCLGYGLCTVNVATPTVNGGVCNGACLVNLGACSVLGGHCEVNLGDCFSYCTVNLGICYGRCLVNLDVCSAGEVCTLQFIICRV